MRRQTVKAGSVLGANARYDARRVELRQLGNKNSCYKASLYKSQADAKVRSGRAENQYKVREMVKPMPERTLHYAPAGQLTRSIESQERIWPDWCVLMLLA